MPQTNYTPILIYASGTTGNTPAAGNLTNSSGGSELAINYFDGRLFYKDASNVVRVLASRGTGTIGGSTNQVQYNSGGVLAGSANLTFDGTSLTVGGKATLVADSPFLTGANLTSGANALAIGGQTGNAVVGFFVNNAEQMRLTTTGLGIGTSSPVVKLQVSATAANVAQTISTTTSGTATLNINGYSASTDMGVAGIPGANVILQNLDTTANSYVSISGLDAGGNIVNRISFVNVDDGNNIGNLVFSTRNLATLTERFRLTPTEAVFNDPGNDYSFRVESDTNTHALFVQGSDGNVGIGTAAPGTKLDVKQSGTNWYDGIRVVRSTNDNQRLVFGNTSGASWIASVDAAGGVNNELIFGRSTNGTTFTESGRFDSSGNLGLGVTPSAWGSESVAIQLGFSGAIQSYKSGTIAEFMNVLSNAYNDNTNWRYIRDGAATRYEQNESVHKWFTSASGLASNTIAFTQAMTLDASGNLMVSPITAPSGMPTAQTGVNVFGGSTVAASTSPGILTLGANSNSILTGEVLGRLQFYSNDASAGLIGSVAKIDCLATNNFAGSEAQTALTFHTNTGVAGSLAERMRLDSSGNLGINATISPWGSNHKAINIGGASSGNIVAPANNMNSGTNYYNNNTNFIYLTTGQFATRYEQGSGQHSWHTAPSGTAGNAIGFTQSMTLDASGNLQLGTTTSGAGIGVTTGLTVQNSTNAAILRSDSSTGGFPLRVWNTATTGDNLFVQILTETVGTQRGSIDYNRAGGLTRYNTTSDYRAKDILGPVQNSGEIIDALKVYEGVMKGATQSRPMLIAHEAQEHAPYAVSGVKDEVKEDGTPKFQQMDVSSLVPLLLAEIQSLRARVAALESQP